MSVTAQQITQAAEDHQNESTYGQLPSGDTQCNFFVRDVVESLLAQSRPELHGSANDIADALAAQSTNWAQTSLNVAPGDTAGIFMSALAQVNAGTIIIVAYRSPDASQHGHLAIIVPSDQLYGSGTWGQVPYLAQAGPLFPGNKPGTENQSVFAKLELSYAFAITRRPNMYLYAFTETQA
jgi:hypothetical protein